MRISIRHETAYTYAEPPYSIIQLLKLTPRSHEGQHVLDWRIECDVDCRFHAGEDAYGNLTHTLSVSAPVSALRIVAEGVVETFDTSGVLAHTIERFPPALFLRETDLTRNSHEILLLSNQTAGASQLSWLHALMETIHSSMTFDTNPTHTTTRASDAWKLRRGVCQDYAHIFISAARARGIPARYIGGHFCRGDGIIVQDAGHAWAEAYVEDLGWTAFDPANLMSPAGNHVRVACGLDYLDAAPVRGARTAGSGENLAVSVLVKQAFGQSQN